MKFEKFKPHQKTSLPSFRFPKLFPSTKNFFCSETPQSALSVSSLTQKVRTLQISPHFNRRSSQCQPIDKWGNPEKAENFIFDFLKGNESPAQIKTKSHDVYSRINKRMSEVCKDLKMDKVTCYSARHSFAMIMSNEGVSISYISEQLGHTSIKTTQYILQVSARKHEHRTLKSLHHFSINRPIMAHT